MTPNELQERLTELIDRINELQAHHAALEASHNDLVRHLKARTWIAPEPWHTKTSMKDGYGIWRHRDGRMDFNKYRFVDGHMEEKVEEGVNACVEDSMTHEEYVEHKYEQHAQKQRAKYSEADRDEEERRLNEHQEGEE